MTLLDTEKIGKKLIKAGYYRDPKNHHHYRKYSSQTGTGSIQIEFKNLYSAHWYANIVFEINSHTAVKYEGHTDVFTSDWVEEEDQKLRALFNFLKVC